MHMQTKSMTETKKCVFISQSARFPVLVRRQKKEDNVLKRKKNEMSSGIQKVKCGTPSDMDGYVRIYNQASFPGVKTTNVDFLSVAVRDSRGLTAAELFGSWTRWPRLPDVSLTQGQNPE